MFRLVFVVFGSAARSESAGHSKESPPVMLFPLRILAVLSLVGGCIGIENIYSRQLFSAESVAQALPTSQQLIAPFSAAPVPALLGLVAAALGFAAAWTLYGKAETDPLPARLGALSRWMRNRFYLDELYEATFIRFHDLLAAVAAWTDRWLIAGLGVRGTHGTIELLGRALRQFQTGNLQTYAFLLALGVAFLLYLVLC
jgi:NADH-quinone oxidoreductase subunit L